MYVIDGFLDAIILFECRPIRKMVLPTMDPEPLGFVYRADIITTFH
jgi:hypothetical protein